MSTFWKPLGWCLSIGLLLGGLAVNYGPAVGDLPGIQWILTTTSPLMAGTCDTREVLALRRIPELGQVALFTGSEARTH